jgi:hypothetical protein
MVTPMTSPPNVAAVAAIGRGRSELIATVTTSISDPCRTALVVHVQRCGARRRFFVVRAFPQSRHQRLNALTMMQFAFPVLVESSSITISC